MRDGIGTVVSLGTDHEFMYKLREAQAEHRITAPAIVTAGRGFGVPDGAPSIAMGMDRVYRPTSADEVRKGMAELARWKPDLAKVWVDDFGNKQTKEMDPKLYLTVIEEAHEHGLKVASHVYYLEDAERLVADGADLLGHSVRDKRVGPDFIAQMKQRDIGYLPTLALDAFFVYADKPAMHNTSMRSMISGNSAAMPKPAGARPSNVRSRTTPGDGCDAAHVLTATVSKAMAAVTQRRARFRAMRA